MSQNRIALLIIDPQYDFYDIPSHLHYVETNNNISQSIAPSLPVPGSWQDALRLQAFIENNIKTLDSITVTLDSHHLYDIAHPCYWIDSKGQHPQPFTQITHHDIIHKHWQPVDHNKYQHVIDYTKTLEDNGLYQLIIWPPHCLMGHIGHTIVTPILSALTHWEQQQHQCYQAIFKGENPDTEHYGGCEAEYPLADDPNTQLDQRLLHLVSTHDQVIISGQALSHCVANTVKQMLQHLSPSQINKLILLVDTSSSVAGFEQQGQAFLDHIHTLGVTIIKSTEITL